MYILSCTISELSRHIGQTIVVDSTDLTPLFRVLNSGLRNLASEN